MVNGNFISVFFFTTVVLYQLPSASTETFRGAISDFISDYDVLNYLPVVSQHRRLKRSVDSLKNHYGFNPIIVRFRALGRRFHLYLQHDDSVMAPDAKVIVSGVPHTVDSVLPVRGYVGPRGYNESMVYGVLNNGVFRGSIRIGDDEPGEYHVEAAFHYTNSSDSSDHSIIYHDRHVDWKGQALNRVRRDVSVGGACALSNPEVASRMHFHEKLAANRFRRDVGDRYRRYTDAENQCGNKHGRVCSLYLQSDTFLWEYIRKKVNSDDAAVAEITSLFNQHVSAAKSIYSKTVFSTRNGEYSFTGIDFRVQRIRINTTRDCSGTERMNNPFCADNVDVINFLNLNAFENHSEYCLAYVFTYRDFQRGTLGLAWVGDANNAGGICEIYRDIPEGEVLVKKSLNTGVVTLLNYGSTVSVKVSQSTFAHEMGHNFGATHDDDDGGFSSMCVPGASSPGGNYIMFSSATGGDKTHNTEFSSCSKDKIARQLHLITTCSNKKRNCLMTENGAFCGNKLVERIKENEWEQCDCGYKNDRECQHDQCCNPGGTKDGCKLKQTTSNGTKVRCSPTAGECCNRECQFEPSSLMCHSGDECRMPSNCTGFNASCPVATPKPDFNTTCSDNTRTCKGGECSGSICAYVGLQECFIDYKSDDKLKKAVEMCYVACREGSSKECISTHNLLTNPSKVSVYPKLKQMLEEFKMLDGIQMKPGAPCDNYRGYCDVFSRCRSVDADGPLTRLKNLIFSPRTLTIIREWITQNWYYVIAMALGVILFMALFVKCCAVHTPSSNPNAPRARSFSETLRRVPRRTRVDGPTGNGRQPNARVIQHGETVELDSLGYRNPDAIEVLTPERGVGGRYTEAPPPYDQATPGHGHGRGRRYQGNHQSQMAQYHPQQHQQKPQPKPRGKKKGSGSSKGGRA